MWIKDYINQPNHQECIYLFYEKLSVESLWLTEKYKSMIPIEYQERRNSTMLEF